MFEPQNPLGAFLDEAANRTGTSSAVLSGLSESEILILPVGDLPTIHNGSFRPEPGSHSNTSKQKAGTSLPFFSSLPRLQSVIGEERKFLKLGVRAFLEMNERSNAGAEPR